MARETPFERLTRMTQMEKEYWSRGIFPGGMDEVGRGPLAGPVVAACVVMPDLPLIEGVNDSKKVAEKKRETLAIKIKEIALCASVGIVEPREIDDINILQATRKAFELAYNSISPPPSLILSDLISGVNISAEFRSFVHGDSQSYLIACASLIAKTTRDAIMIEYDAVYPQYGFARNKGYGTKDHIEAIKHHGLCPLHRLSFLQNYV